MSSEDCFALWELKGIFLFSLIQSSIREQNKVVNELRDTLLKVTEDLLASNKRIEGRKDFPNRSICAILEMGFPSSDLTLPAH